MVFVCYKILYFQPMQKYEIKTRTKISAITVGASDVQFWTVNLVLRHHLRHTCGTSDTIRPISLYLTVNTAER